MYEISSCSGSCANYQNQSLFSGSVCIKLSHMKLSHFELQMAIFDISMIIISLLSYWATHKSPFLRILNLSQKPWIFPPPEIK